MNQSIETIPLFNLSLTFLPVFVVILILYLWSLDSRSAIYAVARMLVQLLAIAYVLHYLFETDQALLIVSVLLIMLAASSWISLRPLKSKSAKDYGNALLAIAIGGSINLFLVTQIVLKIQPWYLPQYMIPLAGMIFATAMNAVSLAAERFESELQNHLQGREARRIALKAALIPSINTLFAVGLVSLPGMMTGQILSGVSPFIAVRYQIMVMCMLFGAAGISAACYLLIQKNDGKPLTN